MFITLTRTTQHNIALNMMFGNVGSSAMVGVYISKMVKIARRIKLRLAKQRARQMRLDQGRVEVDLLATLAEQDEEEDDYDDDEAATSVIVADIATPELSEESSAISSDPQEAEDRKVVGQRKNSALRLQVNTQQQIRQAALDRMARSTSPPVEPALTPTMSSGSREKKKEHASVTFQPQPQEYVSPPSSSPHPARREGKGGVLPPSPIRGNQTSASSTSASANTQLDVALSALESRKGSASVRRDQPHAIMNPNARRGNFYR
jgi:hypothetical protein